MRLVAAAAAAAPLPVTSLLKLKPHSRLPSLVSVLVCLLFQIYWLSSAGAASLQKKDFRNRRAGGKDKRNQERKSAEQLQRTKQPRFAKWISSWLSICSSFCLFWFSVPGEYPAVSDLERGFEKLVKVIFLKNQAFRSSFFLLWKFRQHLLLCSS